MKKTTKTYLQILGIVLVVLLGTFFIASRKAVSPERSIPETASSPSPSISIAAGGAAVRLPLSPGNTLADAVLAAQKSGTLAVSGKDYPGLGFFVTGIGTLREGNGKYLLYYVNGVEASTGISSYVPKDGDSIEWKLQ